MGSFMRDGRGSAVQWFALTAAVLSVASMAGAHALAWLTQPGRLALVAYHAPTGTTAQQAATDSGVDTMPTGSIPSKTPMLRIR